MNPAAHAKKVFHTVEKSFPHCGKLSAAAALAAALLLGGLLFTSGCGRKNAAEIPSLADGQAAVITASISREQIQIGDLLQLRVSVLHREGTRIEFPSVADKKNVVVKYSTLNTNELKNGLLQSIQDATLTSFVVSNHIIGEGAAITISTPEGVQTNPYPFISVEVVSSLSPGETSPRPIQAELESWPAPFPRWIFFVLAGLVAAAGLYAAYALLHKILTTPRTLLRMPPPVPPHITALNALQALRARGWIEEEKAEPFYVELSHIVRRYIERRFGLRAPEMTTDEFNRVASRADALSDPQKQLLETFLSQSDLVKFARYTPGRQTMTDALDTATDFVKGSIPQAPAADGATAKTETAEEEDAP